MPILVNRTFPASEKHPQRSYEFQLNDEEKERFVNEFLKTFFDPTKVPEGEKVLHSVTFKMDFWKTEDIEPEENVIVLDNQEG